MFWHGYVSTAGFNPRAPRGARRYICSRVGHRELFQSTRPARGATPASMYVPGVPASFNPRAPRGARRVSIGANLQAHLFQSTRPARGATIQFVPLALEGLVSIHAPRAGRDYNSPRSRSASRCFNPRAPRGARPPEPIRTPYFWSFNPRAPRGARPPRALALVQHLAVSIHAPRAGRDGDRPGPDGLAQVSIHAPRAGRDAAMVAVRILVDGFNPRAPRGARLGILRGKLHGCVVSIHAPRAGRDENHESQECIVTVSIHAPRAGRDVCAGVCSPADPVSIHAPRAGRDADGARCEKVPFEVSIHAPRAGRDMSVNVNVRGKRVSIHAPRAGRDSPGAICADRESVSIHAPRAGRDADRHAILHPDAGFNPRAPRGARPVEFCYLTFSSQFQSTRPARGATSSPCLTTIACKVSIHAPRAGRDSPPFGIANKRRCFNPRAPRGARRDRPRPGGTAECFNPRAPRGARPALILVQPIQGLFQSTRPARGATASGLAGELGGLVSIHAPRAGRDRPVSPMPTLRPCFNPRAPRGARHADDLLASGLAVVSIHAPRAGRDRGGDSRAGAGKGFNPRAPRGARRRDAAADFSAAAVSIHAPRAGRDGLSVAFLPT